MARSISLGWTPAIIQVLTSAALVRAVRLRTLPPGIQHWIAMWWPIEQTYLKYFWPWLEHS